MCSAVTPIGVLPHKEARSHSGKVTFYGVLFFCTSFYAKKASFSSNSTLLLPRSLAFGTHTSPVSTCAATNRCPIFTAARTSMAFSRPRTITALHETCETKDSVTKMRQLLPRALSCTNSRDSGVFFLIHAHVFDHVSECSSGYSFLQLLSIFFVCCHPFLEPPSVLVLYACG